MIPLDLNKLLGSSYDFLDAEQTRAAIYTPFYYPDGDSVPVYVEHVGGSLRFCDNGGVLWHLMTIGVPLDEPGQDDFIEELARPCGVVFKDDGELELFFEPDHAPAAFTRFMSVMLAAVCWEYEYLARFDEERGRSIADEANIAISV